MEQKEAIVGWESKLPKVHDVPDEIGMQVSHWTAGLIKEIVVCNR